MPNINDYLAEISSAPYGEYVRDAIINAISQCYSDATGTPESVAQAIQNYVVQKEEIDDSVSSLIKLYNNIGTIVQSTRLSNYTTIGINNNEWTQIDSITLSTGRWFLFYGNYVLQASSGRWRAIATTSNDINNLPAWGRLDILMPNSSTSATKGSSARIINVSNTQETWYLWADQSSGNELTMYPYMFAVKIRSSASDDGSSLLEVVNSHTTSISNLNSMVSQHSSSISNLSSQLTESDSNIDAVMEQSNNLTSFVQGLSLGIENSTGLLMLYSDGTEIGNGIDLGVRAKYRQIVTNGLLSIGSNEYGTSVINTGLTDVTIVSVTPTLSGVNNNVPIMLSTVDIVSTGESITISYYNPTNLTRNVMLAASIVYFDNLESEE